jgi:hypothetical protein
MSQLLTEAEAARRLLISLSNLREIRRRGGIRYVAMSADGSPIAPRTAMSMFSRTCGSRKPVPSPNRRGAVGR